MYTLRVPQDPPDDLWSRGNLAELLAMMELAVQEGRYKPDPLVPMALQPSRAVFLQYREHLFGAY